MISIIKFTLKLQNFVKLINDIVILTTRCIFTILVAFLWCFIIHGLVITLVRMDLDLVVKIGIVSRFGV